MNKNDVLIWLDEHTKFQRLLDKVGPERMDKPGVNGEWSMKDIVAHMTGWQHRMVNEVEAASKGKPKPPLPWGSNLESEDATNEWIYDRYKGRSVEEVLEETEALYQKLVGLIRGLPEDVRIEFREPRYYLIWLGDERYPVGEFFDHLDDDHMPDVRAWLERQK